MSASGVSVQQEIARHPLEAELAAIRQRAQGLSNQEAPVYPQHAERIAPLPPDIVEANRQAREPFPSHEFLGPARERAHQGGERAPDAIDRYLNPYQRHVMEAIRRDRTDHLNDVVIPQLRRHFIRAGHRGGAHQERALGRVTQKMERDIAEQQHLMAHRGYETALHAHNLDSVRQLESARVLSQLGVLGQGMKAANLAALREAGASERELEQAKKDLDYEEWKRQHMHPYDMLNFYASLLHGQHYTPSVYRRTENPGPPGLHRREWAAMGMEGLRGLPSIFSFMRNPWGT